jgi:hypothetical protein
MLNTNDSNTTVEAVPSTKDSWIDWFNLRQSADFVNKQAQEELFRAFNATQDADECRRTLHDHQEVMFLFKETFEDQMNVFHHVIGLGGTVYDNQMEFGFIQGVEHDSFTFMTPAKEILCEKPTGPASNKHPSNYEHRRHRSPNRWYHNVQTPQLHPHHAFPMQHCQPIN